MAGANHIVQRIYFRDLPEAQLGIVQGDNGAAATANSFDRQANMYAMEYMSNGDVSHSA